MAIVTHHPLNQSQPPVWAAEWGFDDLPWADLHFGGAVQRFRWIPAGDFLMGSLKGEEGRKDNEGPLHEVRISRGFWLFDTPCTQSFYRAVTGDNPSDFKGDDHPVNNVSWHDACSFVSVLNGQVLGLNLRLPTEAEWEYSCRAGTTESRYGELEEIGWYDENSGGQTHGVKQREANAWGLYDMLGNVWEWCEDHAFCDYTSDSVTDPILRTDDDDASRVIRGGSWFNSAEYARAAFRFGYPPGIRWRNQGFRCLSSPSGPR